MYLYRNPPMPAPAMRDEVDRRSALTTPPPLYEVARPGDRCPPGRLSAAEHSRANTALHHAKSRFPGAVGDVLAAEITAYRDLGYVAQPGSTVVRLIDELLRPQ